MEEARNRDRKYKKRYGTKANEYNIFRRLNTTIFISLLNANRKSNKMRNSIIPDIINISIININNDKFKYYNKRAFVYTIDPRFIHLYNFNIFLTPPMPIFISTRSTRRRLMNFATLIRSYYFCILHRPFINSTILFYTRYNTHRTRGISADEKKVK